MTPTTDEIYYRALFTPDHWDRWRKEQFTSFHHHPPPEWFAAWKAGKRSPEDFALKSEIGVFSPRARQSFLDLMPLYSGGGLWSPEHLRQAGELAGLCAFRTPTEAFRYGGDDEVISRYVEFTGEFICTVPEREGVVVRLVARLTPMMPPRVFTARHKL